MESLDILRGYIREAGEELAEANRELTEKRDGLRTLVLRSLASGISENEAAKLAGITRDTVRRWAGK